MLVLLLDRCVRITTITAELRFAVMDDACPPIPKFRTATWPTASWHTTILGVSQSWYELGPMSSVEATARVRLLIA